MGFFVDNFSQFSFLQFGGRITVLIWTICLNISTLLGYFWAILVTFWKFSPFSVRQFGVCFTGLGMAILSKHSRNVGPVLGYFKPFWVILAFWVYFGYFGNFLPFQVRQFGVGICCLILTVCPNISGLWSYLGLFRVILDHFW